MDKTTAKLVDEAMDKAFGLTPEVLSQIHETVRTVFPGRSEATIKSIFKQAKDIWRPSGTLAQNTTRLIDFGNREPVLTRATPSKEDALRYAEGEYKRLFGKVMDGMQRLTKSREIDALDSDALLNYVPGVFKLDAAKKEIPVATPMNQTDQLDQLVLERYGKTKFEISAVDRRRYHDALRPELDKTDKRSLQIVENAKAVQNAGRVLGPAEKIAAFRASQNLKNG